jgi:hypothetical protein
MTLQTCTYWICIVGSGNKSVFKARVHQHAATTKCAQLQASFICLGVVLSTAGLQTCTPLISRALRGQNSRKMLVSVVGVGLDSQPTRLARHYLLLQDMLVKRPTMFTGSIWRLGSGVWYRQIVLGQGLCLASIL